MITKLAAPSGAAFQLVQYFTLLLQAQTDHNNRIPLNHNKALSCLSLLGRSTSVFSKCLQHFLDRGWVIVNGGWDSGQFSAGPSPRVRTSPNEAITAPSSKPLAAAPFTQ